jgi:hypothetical protein
MSEELPLNRPWLIAVWPGMGNVAISAGYYLAAKLGMHLIAEFSAEEYFDVDHVEVSRGLLRTGRLPRSRLFLWKDPKQVRDLIVFIGEAQPETGKYAFCRKLAKYAHERGVERVFTFAAMATRMHPEHPSRVFGAATNAAELAELRRLHLEVLEDGQISGLNGVLLGAAAEAGLRGACLLGEMPHIFSQLPFPKASLAVLRVFMQLAGIELDLTELEEQAEAMDQQLSQLLSQVEAALERQAETGEEGEEEEFAPAPAEEEEEHLAPADRQRIDKLFLEAQQDRSKAYELKQELDRLGVFVEYEDRFLDLFKNRE